MKEPDSPGGQGETPQPCRSTWDARNTGRQASRAQKKKANKMKRRRGRAGGVSDRTQRRSWRGMGVGVWQRWSEWEYEGRRPPTAKE